MMRPVKYSHLLDAFTGRAWYLHDEVHARLSDVLEAHVLGRKDALRAVSVERLSFAVDTPADAPSEIAGDYLIDNVAVIDVRGVLAMHADQVNGDCLPQGRSYDSIAGQLATALAMPEVKAVVLRLETPGGSACGCQELYDQISAATKPVHAYVSGYAFSAGYYLAAACSSIVASSRSAHTGSIGTVMSFWDTSAKNAADGLSKVVIRSGAYKAMVQQGEAVTDAARAELQRECDAYAAAFHDAVRAGRGLTDAQATEVLNGRTFLADQAQALGLIDAIQPFAAFLADLASQEPDMLGFTKKTTAQAATVTTTTASAGISKETFAALAAAHPDAVATITALDAEGASAEAIEAAILRTKVTALGAQLATATSAVATAQAAHAEALAAKDATISELTAKVQKFESWKGTVTATTDPGADQASDAPRTASGIKAAWDASAELRQQFALGGISSYVEHLCLTGQLTSGEAKAIAATLK